MRTFLTLLLTATVMTVAVHFGTTFTPVQAGDSLSKQHLVEIRNLEFTPKELVVAPGDTITWVNYDLVPHTVTADNESWDSGLISAQEKWQIVVQEDMYPTYFCQYHPIMKAQLRIDPR